MVLNGVILPALGALVDGLFTHTVQVLLRLIVQPHVWGLDSH